ncbi:MAG: hypothetical protein ACKPKO_46385 [Candidatus Fonsibacter sp.]
MRDAKAGFHYQLFKSEHRSYYGARDLGSLDECRTVANVGWLRRLSRDILRSSKRRRPLPINKDSIAEIDVSKAYRGPS